MEVLLSQADSRKTRPFRLRGKPPAQLLSRGVLLGLAPLALALAVAPEARAIAPVPVIDNIDTSAFPPDTTVKFTSVDSYTVISFSTPNADPYQINSLKLALSTPNTTVAGARRSLIVGLYAASNSVDPNGTSPLLGTSYRPIGGPLAQTTYTASYNTSGNVTTGGGFTKLGSSELGALYNYTLASNTNYSLVFSTIANVIRSHSMGVAYTDTNGFVSTNNTGISGSNGTGLNPISANAWSPPTATNLQNIAFTLEVSQVPGPLPVLGAAAAFGYSRRLRRRIQQQP